MRAKEWIGNPTPSINERRNVRNRICAKKILLYPLHAPASETRTQPSYIYSRRIYTPPPPPPAPHTSSSLPK